MAAGKVNINSDVVNNALGCIVSSCGVLESDLTGKIPGNFQVLSDLGFISSGLSKIEEQVQSIISSEKSIIATISGHLQKVDDTDDDLLGNLNNGRNPVYSGGNGGSSGGSGSGTDVDDINNGKKINYKKIIDYIPKLDDDSKNNLLNFIRIKKDKKTSLVDLLFDTSKAEELYVLLKAAFGSKVKEKDLTLDDYKEAQRVLLKMIFESEITNVKLNENSIISAKEYLVKISKENKIDVVDLVLDEKYQNTLRLSLYKLYKGEGVSNISQQTIDDFRNYIDKVAKENNITVKQLFTSKFKLLL